MCKILDKNALNAKETLNLTCQILVWPHLAFKNIDRWNPFFHDWRMMIHYKVPLSDNKLI